MKHRKALFGILLGLVTLVAACSADPTPTPVPTATPTPEAMTAMVEPGDELLLIALNPLSDSGQSGWAALTAKGDQIVVVLDLAPGALQTELVHIHAGQCGDTLGGVAHPLTNFVGGSGASKTTVDVTLDSLGTGAFAINAHKKDEPGVYTACGNVPAASETVTIPLGELDGSGQSGSATLTARGAMTEVVLNISSGALETELVHVHTGQCGDALGGVAHPLTNFVGGSGVSVTMVDASLDSIRTGDFAINAHKKDEPGVYTACGNIPSM